MSSRVLVVYYDETRRWPWLFGLRAGFINAGIRIQSMTDIMYYEEQKQQDAVDWMRGRP